MLWMQHLPPHRVVTVVSLGQDLAQGNWLVTALGSPHSAVAIFHGTGTMVVRSGRPAMPSREPPYHRQTLIAYV